MAIYFGDNSIQSFSAKIIQVKRVLRTTQYITNSGSMGSVTSMDFTPKANSSTIHCQLSGVFYTEQEPGGLRGRFYDVTDGNRFGLGLHSSEDPLLFRQDLQNLSNGGSYSYCGGLWRAQESSWGATNQKNIAFQIAQANNGYVGFISEFMPATFTITEVME